MCMGMYHLKFTESGSTAISFHVNFLSLNVSLKKHTYINTNKQTKETNSTLEHGEKQTKKQIKHVGEMGPFQLKNLKEKEFLSQYFQKTTISE